MLPPTPTMGGACARSQVQTACVLTPYGGIVAFCDPHSGMHHTRPTPIVDGKCVSHVGNWPHMCGMPGLCKKPRNNIHHSMRTRKRDGSCSSSDCSGSICATRSHSNSTCSIKHTTIFETLVFESPRTPSMGPAIDPKAGSSK